MPDLLAIPAARCSHIYPGPRPARPLPWLRATGKDNLSRLCPGSSFPWKRPSAISAPTPALPVFAGTAGTGANTFTNQSLRHPLPIPDGRSDAGSHSLLQVPELPGCRAVPGQADGRLPMADNPLPGDLSLCLCRFIPGNCGNGATTRPNCWPQKLERPYGIAG